ncbi:hypothetical protein ACFL35_16055 [Candidatus Riflebacteria bacterium]
MLLVFDQLRKIVNKLAPGVKERMAEDYVKYYFKDILFCIMRFHKTSIKVLLDSPAPIIFMYNTGTGELPYFFIMSRQREINTALKLIDESLYTVLRRNDISYTLSDYIPDDRLKQQDNIHPEKKKTKKESQKISISTNRFIHNLFKISKDVPIKEIIPPEKILSIKNGENYYYLHSVTGTETWSLKKIDQQGIMTDYPVSDTGQLKKILPADEKNEVNFLNYSIFMQTLKGFYTI